MGGILNEYIDKRLSFNELQLELVRLMKSYNSYTGRYLFIYASDLNKGKQGVLDISLDQDDFYNIQDMLRECSEKKIDIYIETPGGSAESAEEIVRFLHKKFDEVNFVIAGEAKSAGTILVLGGDNIYMTDSGSLGPIDAQIKVGRSVQSAYDYKEWVVQKKEEASKNGHLNIVDAQIISQITPGELSGIIDSLDFAKDLVSEWLVNYKFKNWKIRKSSGVPVTDDYKKQRANDIAEKLCNHHYWRSHGRSIKIEDLKNVLQIKRIDNDEKLADIIYRIKMVLKLIFGGSGIYKIYRTIDSPLFKNIMATPNNIKNIQPLLPQSQKKIQCIKIQTKCPKCGKIHIINSYLNITSDEAKKMGLSFTPNINDKNVLTCDICGYMIDLNLIINQIEQKEKCTVIIK
jgi:hypothetical protein